MIENDVDAISLSLSLSQNGNLIWTDGSKWDYTNWVPGQPDGNGDCVQINWNSKWLNIASQPHYKTFLCPQLPKLSNLLLVFKLLACGMMWTAGQNEDISVPSI